MSMGKHGYAVMILIEQTTIKMLSKCNVERGKCRQQHHAGYSTDLSPGKSCNAQECLQQRSTVNEEYHEHSSLS